MPARGPEKKPAQPAIASARAIGCTADQPGGHCPAKRDAGEEPQPLLHFMLPLLLAFFLTGCFLVAAVGSLSRFKV